MKGYIPNKIDHKDRNRKNNKWDNLREVSDLDNAKNITLQKNSATEVNGVSYHKPTGRYRAYIGIGYKQKHLGMFDTLEEATTARKKADVAHSYYLNHGTAQGSE